MTFALINRRYPWVHRDLAWYDANQRPADQFATGGRHDQPAVAFCLQRIIRRRRISSIRWIGERPCFASFARQVFHFPGDTS
ncbi:hypothetical protein D3C81_1235170 [compost metagenome]